MTESQYLKSLCLQQIAYNQKQAAAARLLWRGAKAVTRGVNTAAAGVGAATVGTATKAIKLPVNFVRRGKGTKGKMNRALGVGAAGWTGYDLQSAARTQAVRGVRGAPPKAQRVPRIGQPARNPAMPRMPTAARPMTTAPQG